MSGGHKVRIKDVASRANVANSTVSHVLNGTAPITQEVRERVLNAAKELGYLAKREMRATITVLGTALLAVDDDALPENETNLVSWTILNALTQDCQRRGVKLIPWSTSGDLDKKDIVMAAREAKADGIIILSEDSPALLGPIYAASIPAVLINGEDQEMHIDSVSPGNRFGAQLATNWLIRQGHKKILHLTWDGRTTISRRQDGFLDALRDSGLPAGNGHVLKLGGYEPRYGEEAIEQWIKEHGGLGGITAVFTASDNLAFGTMKALSAHGYSVPDDISVMGFDGIALGELIQPPLTTIRIPLNQMGPAAINLLEQRILINDKNRAGHRLELGCSIVERESVAAL